MPPSCRFNGHVRLGGHGGADPNHTDGIIFSIRRRVCLEEKVKQKGSQVLFRCLVCCQNPNVGVCWRNGCVTSRTSRYVIALCYTTALFADWRMWVRARRNVRKAKAAVSQHNAGNARKQQAHSNGSSVCGADMWVWWGWRGGCVTVAATQHCDCFQKPSAEARGTVRKKNAEVCFSFFQRPAAVCRKLRFIIICFMRCYVCSCGCWGWNVWMDKGEFKRDEWCWRKQI